ncbi:MAG: GxxExxY protein [Chloroflexi bacterium]|nr:GxxExxY protein [Chloroflexota bacterium]
MTKLLHEKLSYDVRGILFDVHNKLGPMLPENIYNQAVAIGLENQGIHCQTEKEFEVTYHGVQVGRYFVDVWVEAGKLLLELKVAPQIGPLHQAQAISYLKVTDADLAFVVNFGEDKVTIDRLPNFVRDKPAAFSWQAQALPPDVLYPDQVNEILSVLYRVYFELGPGFFHQVYRRATMVELRERGLGYEYIKKMPIFYQDHHLADQEVRLIALDGKVLLATIAVREVTAAMKRQLRARMRYLGYKLGLIANFHGAKLETVFVRQG